MESTITCERVTAASREREVNAGKWREEFAGTMPCGGPERPSGGAVRAEVVQPQVHEGRQGT